MNIMENIYEKAKRAPGRVAFPESQEEKILLAAKECYDKGYITPVLVGEPSKIKEAAAAYGVSLDGFEIADSTDEEFLDTLITQYIDQGSLLGAKGLKRRCEDPLYAALMMQAIGTVDICFAGLTHTTGEVILAGQTIVGLQEGVAGVSSIGIFDIPGYSGSEGSLLAFGDSAVMTDPDEQELAGIAIAACDTVTALLGWTPRCAMLSFSTDGSIEHPKVDIVRNAVKIANTQRPDLKIDGEFQLDSAINPEVAKKKVKRNSDVAGRANIIIWPDLNVGNVGVKLVQQFAKADAYGPVLQGFRKVVGDCSRGAPVSELVGNIAMSVVRAATNA